MRTEDIRNMAKAYAAVLEKAKNEELKGDQHKIDANGNGKVDAHDFKMLRKKSTKKETATKSTTTVSNNAKTDTDVQTQEAKEDNPPFSGGKPIKAVNKDKYGNVIKDKNRPKHLAKMAMQKQKNEEVELDEISKATAGEYIKHANINTADAADQNARKSSMGQKSSIGKVMKRIKGVSTAVDKLTGKAKVPARESVEQIDELKKGDWVVHGGGKVGQVHNVSGDKASVDVKWNKTGRISSHAHSSLKKMKEEVKIDEAAATAQHKPDEKTSDTREKQLKRSKGEKDFVDQHKAETPEAGDEPKVDAMNFQKFKAMTGKIGKDTSRKADNRKGDNNIVPSGTPIKDPAAPKIREQSEQLDELSIDTLKSYKDKADKDASKKHKYLRKNMFPSSKDSNYKINKFYSTLKKKVNRDKGTDRAWKKLVDKGAYPGRKPGEYGIKVVSKKDKN